MAIQRVFTWRSLAQSVGGNRRLLAIFVVLAVTSAFLGLVRLGESTALGVLTLVVAAVWAGLAWSTARRARP